ncbi:unnamed protein product [Acanthoscelides obtectus]|uniref:Uncharacterized protein n=1 Tax=Acanthoscelides obtectus TaxID=200917 RepID=A0A9P0PV76_ACAOB|nr:unnamed protein product [Acanthoscelides obtectus]CAK1641829.1 hypothetical protein AOBTE_LOCUS12663 [Acanthoscelides obtectus]
MAYGSRLILFLLIFITFFVFSEAKLHKRAERYGVKDIRNRYGGDLSAAILDIIQGIPLEKITVGFDSRAV